MYFSHYDFSALELLLLAATAILGLVAAVDDMVLAPRRRLQAAQPPAVTTGMRVVQIGFLLLFVRMMYSMIKRSALDFSFVLVVALALCGLFWFADRFFLRPQRLALAKQHTKPQAEAEALPTTVEYAVSFFPVILVVLVIRSFLLEPFRIPSDSMMPTLFDGDFIFVNKYAYGLRLPVTNTKIIEIGTPKRGDVIVFRLPTDPSINYIKRLVGLPGDHVVVHNNQVFINGTLMQQTLDGKYSDTHGYFDAQLATEQLGDVKHIVMFTQDRSATNYEAQVPAGHYFFMGDNRNNSQDSRFPQVGFVPEQNLVGHAVRIWMNWRGNEMPVWSRIGTKIE
jgi:signal peptidase I